MKTALEKNQQKRFEQRLTKKALLIGWIIMMTLFISDRTLSPLFAALFATMSMPLPTYVYYGLRKGKHDLVRAIRSRAFWQKIGEAANPLRFAKS